MEPKKIVVVVLMLIFIAGLGFFGFSKIANPSGNKAAENSTELPNPMVERASTDEIRDTLGFTFNSLPSNTSDIKYFTIDNTIAEADFTADGVTYTVRKAEANAGDITGVYTEFTNSQTIASSAGIDVLYKYNEGSEGLATWTAGDYVYSAFCESDARLDAMQSIVNAVS